MENISHYSVLERLGEGALGELFRARDTRLGRTVALRIVSKAVADQPSSRQAFLTDATAAAALSHPHIAALFDFGEDAGRLYLAHEFVPGNPLQALMTGRPFDVGLAIELAVQLADAIAEAHRHGVVHGDLRPATIFVTPTDQTKIIEFGLSAWSSGGIARKTVSRQLGAGQEPPAEQGDTLVAYLSPEQVLGDRVDGRSDIFSLGVVLYQMLTGRAPFAGATPSGTALKILQCAPPPPTRQNPELPAGFDPIIARALAKSLDARYPAASAFASDLRALAAQMNLQVTAEVRDWQGEKAVEPARRRTGRRLLILGIVLVVLAGLGAVGWFQRDAIRRLLGGEPPPPRPVVAVLPFEMPPGDARAYFGVGFSEDLASRLGEVPGLSVVGRSLIRRTPVPRPDEIARQVGAAAVLSGTIEPGPYSLRVDVRLVESATGRVIWADRFSREPRQASAAQAEIARQVADHLRLPLPAGNRWAAAQIRQVDPAAYDLYLQARDAAEHRDRSRAVALYHQAMDLDNKLVEAHVGLSEALYLDDFYSSGAGDASAMDRAWEEAEAALAADPEMPRAHLAAALSAPTVVDAASSIARALALDPSLGEAWHHAGDLVIELDPARSIAFYRRSLALEPAIDANHRDIASALEMLDRLPEAEQAVAAGQAMRPDRPWWVQMEARLEMVRQHYDRTIEMLDADPSAATTPFAWLVGRVLALRMASKTDQARAEATRLLARYPWFCEGQAVMAGLWMDAGGRQQAHALADPIFAQAASPSAPRAVLQCGVLAAAALAQAPEAAGYLSMVAGDERALRAWTRQGVFSLGLTFRRHWYPWDKVIQSMPFQQASAELRKSLDQLRDEVARRLPAPPAK